MIKQQAIKSAVTFLCAKEIAPAGDNGKPFYEGLAS
jgi:hypothetical protein